MSSVYESGLIGAAARAPNSLTQACTQAPRATYFIRTEHHIPGKYADGMDDEYDERDAQFVIRT
jgi:hypothetical protein